MVGHIELFHHHFATVLDFLLELAEFLLGVELQLGAGAAVLILDLRDGLPVCVEVVLKLHHKAFGIDGVLGELIRIPIPLKIVGNPVAGYLQASLVLLGYRREHAGGNSGVCIGSHCYHLHFIPAGGLRAVGILQLPLQLIAQAAQLLPLLVELLLLPGHRGLLPAQGRFLGRQPVQDGL